VATAVKRGTPDADVVDAAVESMTTLNAAAAEVVRGARPHAVTDVTGFGLVGHAREVADGAGLRAEIDFAAVTLLPGVRGLIDEGYVPGGTRTNLELASAYTDFGSELSESDRLLACDAQTSGGLLVALPAERAATLPWPVIGRLSAGPAGTVLVD
jgi:selenide,water dikinase